MYVVVGGPIQAASGIVLMARVLGQTGTPINQAALASIGYVVTDLTAGTVGVSTPLTVSTVIFNALQQNDPRWVLDSQYSPGPDGNFGYNFLAALPASTFPLTPGGAIPEGYPPIQNHDYQIDVSFVPVVGQTTKQTWRVSVSPTFG